MQNDFWNNFIRFTFFVLLQTLVLCHIHLPGHLHLILYPIAVMMLPLQINNVLLLLTAFLCGLLVDAGCSTPGLNAFAATLLAFARIVYFKITDTHDTLHDSDITGTPAPAALGWLGFIKYSAWMCAVFFIGYFFMEAGGFGRILYTLYLAVTSAAVCFAAQIITAGLFVKRAQNR